MIQLAYVTIRDIDNAAYDALYRTATPERRQRADRCRREDALRCIAADALLRYAAASFGIRDISVNYNDCGKPILADAGDFHFNLSHSDQWAAIAWGDSEVGIDLEAIRERESIPLITRRHFTIPEQKYVLAGDQIKRFFEIWTAKESYLKYRGTGLTKPLRTFCTRNPEALGVEFYTFFPEDGFCLTVCAKDACATPQKLSIRQLLQQK